MKIALAQLNYHIGHFEKNNAAIVRAISLAKDQQADLIVFAELAIGGYPAQDLLHQPVFIQHAADAIDLIATHCQDIACIIGAPIRNTNAPGKPLYNAAVCIEQGKISHISRKARLPNDDVFDESRYFEPAHAFTCFHFKGAVIALTICEDLWNEDRHAIDPMEELRRQKPNLLINIAASPFSYTHFENRLQVLRQQVARAGCPLVYVNQVGAQLDLIFDGRSLVLDAEGKVLCTLKKMEEDLQFVDFEAGKWSVRDEKSAEQVSEIALIHDALLLGLRDYFQKSGFQKAVLGLSGGLDSAVVAALACEALGAENVWGILMPSAYSSDHSLADALDLVKNTGCQHQLIPIKELTSAFENSLSTCFQGLALDTTEENIQARTRGTILMAMANKFGYILLNTSNKSESAVGYGTLYGDMAGSISVIGDLYKTQVYDLANYINRNKTLIPWNTISKPPSAELRPDQKDSDSLPPYELLDELLYQLIELGKTGSELVRLGYDEGMVRRISTLLNQSEFKRFQAAPALRISPKAFGRGRSMPLVAKYPF